MLFDTPLLEAKKHVRQLRGGSQAHLIEAKDGHFYAVKFMNNRQGRRILVNELVASLLLRTLGIDTATPAIVSVEMAFIRDNPDLFTVGSKTNPIRPGVHFGSRYPVSPGETTIYDFLPDSLLSSVINLSQFFAVLVADKWLGNCDGRQSVFFRVVVNPATSTSRTPTVKWVTVMIDHGSTFGGSDWVFRDSAAHGLYARRAVYGCNPTLRNLEPTLALLMDLSRSTLDEVFFEIPPDWLAGEELKLLRLLRKLYDRREYVPMLVAESLQWISELNRAKDVNRMRKSADFSKNP
jgi:hypothetical protein